MDIFTDEELKAADAVERQLEEGAEQGTGPGGEEAATDQPRDEQGRFAAKDKEGDDGRPPEKHVPQGALHAEREKRKASDQRANSAEAELKKLQEQLGAIAKLREQVNARPTPQAPTEQDGGNELDYLKSRLAELEQQTTRVGRTLDNQTLDNQEQAAIHAALSHSEALFRQSTPDYDAAVHYVLNARASELALYGLSPVEVRTALANEVADIAKAAIQQGKDPAELGYAIAQSRGYRPESAGAQSGGTGKGAAKIEAIGHAKAQSKSIGQAAGSSPEQLTAEAIIAMSPAEFEALYMTAEGRATIDAICGA